MGSYSLGEVARITGVSRARLRYWERTALLAPCASGAGEDQPEFEFRDLVSVRSVLALLKRGVSLRRIRAGVDALRVQTPEVQRPLDCLRPSADGSRRVVLFHDGIFVEPDGQLVFDFSEAEEALPRELRAPDLDAAAQRSADEWFDRGCQLDSNRAAFGEAIDAYQRALAIDPDFADAHCNLGSIFFHQDRSSSASACFERALRSDPNHVEANLNLAILLEEKGRNQWALRHYKAALNADPMYADTHVSLALLYEKLGLRRTARGYWRRYLQLDPAGTWVDIAERRLRD